MHTSIKATAIAIAASGMALTAPVNAAPAAHAAPVAHSAYGGAAAQGTSFEHHRRWHRGGHGNGNKQRYYGNRYQQQRYYQNPYQQQRYYGEPVYRDTRVWRGQDGNYYCRKRDGTTGLLIGGVVGALAGREIAGRNGDRTLGAILGGAVGALLGRSVDRNRGNSYCR